MMAKKEQNKVSIASKINPVSEYEERFKFIDEDILRINIAIAFQYITFLIAVMDEENAEESTISSSVYKNMILYTASVVEGCLHYCLGYMLENGLKEKTEVIFKGDYVIKSKQDIYIIDKNTKICGCKMAIEYQAYDNKMKFQNLIRICRKADILDDILAEKCESIRKMRNKIHLASLGEIDSVYKKTDATNIFLDANSIITRIEELLTSK